MVFALYLSPLRLFEEERAASWLDRELSTRLSFVLNRPFSTSTSDFYNSGAVMYAEVWDALAADIADAAHTLP